MPPTSLNTATVFPIRDDGNAPATIARAWVTNIATADAGVECRASTAAVPVRTLSYTALFFGAQEAGQFKARWLAAPERLRCIVPLWPRFATPADIPDLSTLTGDFADRGFVAGAKAAILWQSETDWELLDVATVADDMLTLSTPIAGSYVIGAAQVIPVMTAWLAPPTPEQLAVDAEGVPVVFTEEIPGVAGIDPTVGAAAMPVVDALTVDTIYHSSSWGPKKIAAWRVTALDAAGSVIPHPPLTWNIGSEPADPDRVIRFPGNGNVVMTAFQGNAFDNYLLSVTSGTVTSPTFGPI